MSAMFLIVRSDYFYPRPPRGGRQKARTTAISIPQFLSTPSARRATWPVSLICPVMLFLSTPSARRATSRPFPSFGLCPFLSTPSARRATWGRAAHGKSWIFLSTPSARRATTQQQPKPTHPRNFYPRPPRGGRLWVPTANRARGNFYPRPPRGGRRGRLLHITCVMRDFYPRPPRGGRLRGAAARTGGSAISIHALREEGDQR